ncbi:MAG: hypothetical protein QXM68_04225 [Candidatus Aenigmatarchaeota archaeon]|nr:hypothetical protein [Candidatus Aenigmarchaeota archaeon]
MSFIQDFFRNLFKLLAGFVFVLSFSAFITSLAILNFTDKDNLLPLLTNVFQTRINQIDNTSLQSVKESFEIACQNSSKVQQNAFGYNIEFDCSQIDSNFTFSLAKNIANSIYYAKPDCDFLSCISYNPTYTITESFRSIIIYARNISLILSIISALAIIALSKGDFLSRLTAVLVSVIFICLPVLLIDFITANLQEQMTDNLEMTYPIIENFVDIVKHTFLTFLVGSVVILLIVLLVRFVFNIGKNK